MDPLFLAGIVAIALLSAFGLPLLGGKARRRRALRRQPLRALGEAASGEVVRVRGVVSAIGAEVQLPFVARAGVLHHTQLIDTSNPGATTTFERGARSEMLIDDGTGRARIAVDTLIDFIAAEETGGIGRDESELVALLGADRERIFSKGAVLTWRQRSISVGDTVEAWGRVVQEPDPTGPRDGAHYRAEPLRVVLVPAEPGAVVIVEVVSRARP
jgi:hypothetical protein